MYVMIATNEYARKDLDKKMLITERSVISKILTHMVVKKNGTKFRSITVVAQKRELGEKSRDKQEPLFSLRVSNTILAQSVVTVLGLGFIDAGYSGDWSRIGVISKEAENLLKLTTFVVIPLCLFLIFSFSKKQEA
ncbi:uncharacterized protein LOC114287741 isoform X1 [Camellia sinensis]|uniref:uncharacterized protein LOC114287741 isoform X1 n=1 Tax=Camellia sinensis TaxID=4442 RepID=UPI001036CC91|nr:uncharacterized protein LOC114287741 isoform X1 [Camellia sinensis]